MNEQSCNVHVLISVCCKFTWQMLLQQNSCWHKQFLEALHHGHWRGHEGLWIFWQKSHPCRLYIPANTCSSSLSVCLVWSFSYSSSNQWWEPQTEISHWRQEIVQRWPLLLPSLNFANMNKQMQCLKGALSEDWEKRVPTQTFSIIVCSYILWP